MRLRTLTAVCMLFLAACSADAPTMADPGWRSVTGRNDANFTETVGDYLTAVGCSAQEGPRDSATVAIPITGMAMQRFSCPNVPRDSVRAGVSRFRAALRASMGGAAVTTNDPGGDGNGGMVYMFTTYHCEIEDHYNYVPAMGVYVYTGTTGHCDFVEYWWNPNSGGLPPQPSGDTVPPPPDLPAADSCPNSGDTVEVLSSKEMQDSLAAVFQESVASNTEMGGAFVAINGQVRFIRGVADPSATDNCNWRGTTPVAGMVVLATWHTHPDPDNATINCRLSGPMTVNNRPNGGGSPQDWMAADSTGKPVYTRGPGYIYRLDPGVAPGSRPLNSNEWIVGAGRCAARVQA